jgi:low affinity Fe/Cu permease
MATASKSPRGATSKGAASKAAASKSSKDDDPVRAPAMPSDVTDHLSWFDKFATKASAMVSKAAFFAACVIIVIVWAPSIVLIHSISTWQLIINTLTTIITFLLVALLQNTQERSDKAIQVKLNAIADSLSDLMKAQGLDKDATELRQAVGLEDRESS